VVKHANAVPYPFVPTTLELQSLADVRVYVSISLFVNLYSLACKSELKRGHVRRSRSPVQLRDGVACLRGVLGRNLVALVFGRLDWEGTR
jgi:hypothetical protein